MKKRFTEARSAGFLRETDAGVTAKDLCRKHGFSAPSYYLWRRKCGDMSVSEARRLEELEHTRLKRLLAESPFENEVTREAPPPNMVTAPARRLLVRRMTERSQSERRALAVVGMSAPALRSVPAPDRNTELRARIVALVHRHRRHGAGMIHMKLRQAGERVNAKRVHRLYVEERLQVRRRRRKKIPVRDRQPLVKPTATNDVWSADFGFDPARRRMGS